jgi:hypothetical protein
MVCDDRTVGLACSTRFDSSANNMGPWPASLGCTTNSYLSGLAHVRAGGRHSCLHHFVGHPAKEEGIGLLGVLSRVPLQVFVPEHCMSTVQYDVDLIRMGRIT